MDQTRQTIRKILGEARKKGVVYYHVTHTKLAPTIEKEGLRTMQTSNWLVSGSKERYGEGQVFAFEDEMDAIRWASRMDWEFNQSTGSGLISIVGFTPPEGEWEEDEADPFAQAGAYGQWLKSRTPVPPENIVSIEPVTNEVVRAFVEKDQERFD